MVGVDAAYVLCIRLMCPVLYVLAKSGDDAQRPVLDKPKSMYVSNQSRRSKPGLPRAWSTDVVDMLSNPSFDPFDILANRDDEDKLMQIEAMSPGGEGMTRDRSQTTSPKTKKAKKKRKKSSKCMACAVVPFTHSV